jgi:hypothetical protein
VVVAADFVSPSLVRCAAPPAPNGDGDASDLTRAVAVRVANDGASFSDTSSAPAFHFVDPVRAATASPASGPDAGGTVLRLLGSGFQRHVAYACTFGAVFAGGAVASAPAVFVHEGAVACVAPRAPVGGGVVRVGVSVSGHDVTMSSGSGATFSYHAPPRLAALIPASGGLHGGTRVAVRGAGLEGVAWCRLVFFEVFTISC